MVNEYFRNGETIVKNVLVIGYYKYFDYQHVKQYF